MKVIVEVAVMVAAAGLKKVKLSAYKLSLAHVIGQTDRQTKRFTNEISLRHDWELSKKEMNTTKKTNPRRDCSLKKAIN